MKDVVLKLFIMYCALNIVVITSTKAYAEDAVSLNSEIKHVVDRMNKAEKPLTKTLIDLGTVADDNLIVSTVLIKDFKGKKYSPMSVAGLNDLKKTEAKTLFKNPYLSKLLSLGAIWIVVHVNSDYEYVESIAIEYKDKYSF